MLWACYCLLFDFFSNLSALEVVVFLTFGQPFRECTWNNPQRIGKDTRRLKNQKTSRDYLDYNITNNRPEYWEDSWKLEKTCCHSNSSEKPSLNDVVKNSQKCKIIIIITIIKSIKSTKVNICY